MKKWMWLLPLAAILAFSACSIPGEVYLVFDWATKPTDWWCTDPNIDPPGVTELFPDHYYHTEPGDYHFAYTHDVPVDLFSPYYDIYYTLTAHTAIGSPGEDAYFMMYLNEGAYPTFWQTQSLSGPSAGSTAAARSVVQSGTTFDKSGYEYRQLGEYSQTQGRYTLTVRTGVWEPKQ
jgi:hypothetical protein